MVSAVYIVHIRVFGEIKEAVIIIFKGGLKYLTIFTVPVVPLYTSESCNYILQNMVSICPFFHSHTFAPPDSTFFLDLL